MGQTVAYIGGTLTTTNHQIHIGSVRSVLIVTLDGTSKEDMFPTLGGFRPHGQ